jgi:hypothetical protein
MRHPRIFKLATALTNQINQTASLTNQINLKAIIDQSDQSEGNQTSDDKSCVWESKFAGAQVHFALKMEKMGIMRTSQSTRGQRNAETR